MKRTIIILSVLLLASTASAQVPYRYQCLTDAEHKMETTLCSSLAAAMSRNTNMIEAEDPDLPYFQLVILPTERGGYISVTIASNLIYPPLNGLALSAYLGGFLILPDMLDIQVADEIMSRTALGTSKWIIGSEDAIRAIPQDSKSLGLFAANEGEDD